MDTLIKTIHDSPKIVNLVCIGPVTNIKFALQKDPSIAPKCNFIGMHGAVYKGYNGGSVNILPEYNIKMDVGAMKAVFAANWNTITITPLDTCGIIRLENENYQKVVNASENNPALTALLEQSKIWAKNVHFRCYSKKTLALQYCLILWQFIWH